MVKFVVEVKHLLDYNEKIRHRYFEALEKLPWAEFVKDREASFHSMRNIFVHTLGAVNYWLDFLKKENTRSRKEFDDYTNFQDVQTLMEQVEKRTHDYLDPLSTDGLKEKFTVTNDMNEMVAVTAEDILIHVFEEEVHHRGELIALLWQMGIEPPLMGWKYL
jgi:uncharacterized damage-inducible protein DinB